jgi:hypothetical protein
VVSSVGQGAADGWRAERLGRSDWGRDQGGDYDHLHKALLGVFPAVAAYPRSGAAKRSARLRGAARRLGIGRVAGGEHGRERVSSKAKVAMPPPCLRPAMTCRPARRGVVQRRALAPWRASGVPSSRTGPVSGPTADATRPGELPCYALLPLSDPGPLVKSELAENKQLTRSPRVRGKPPARSLGEGRVVAPLSRLGGCAMGEGTGVRSGGGRLVGEGAGFLRRPTAA